MFAWPALVISLSSFINQKPLRLKEGGNGTMALLYVSLRLRCTLNFAYKNRPSQLCRGLPVDGQPFSFYHCGHSAHSRHHRTVIYHPLPSVHVVTQYDAQRHPQLLRRPSWWLVNVTNTITSSSNIQEYCYVHNCENCGACFSRLLFFDESLSSPSEDVQIKLLGP